MRTLIAAILAFGLAAPALAAEPEGCDKFKWPIESDRAALTAPNRTPVASGSARTAGTKAVTLALLPLDKAALPMPPERKRAAEGFAGYLMMAAPEKSGSFTLSMASAVWIDAIQNGQYLKPVAFSGAIGCEGIRKTMRFDLGAQPFVVQVSGSTDETVALLVRGSD
jgi:hypothetical protein